VIWCANSDGHRANARSQSLLKASKFHLQPRHVNDSAPVKVR